MTTANGLSRSPSKALMSQRSSVTLPPINSDFRSARKSVPISHTPKIASSGIVIEEGQAEPPEPESN